MKGSRVFPQVLKEGIAFKLMSDGMPFVYNAFNGNAIFNSL